ncbi:hypothetical protein BN59_02089 [Legionella massiliensis]|uniref:Uncharacterized protein n=1 Tax=Legionella massiliensis TaxID=1034943 RepID=A0A078L182_9GAMM|nr:hypothetical protein BN59_02089 [Legionella massiliensis]CEE13537.1 hypothetical protein BN1094_02089 [Legionella massiliensis]
MSVIDEPCHPNARHPERSEGSGECGTVLISEILRCALDDIIMNYALILELAIRN